MPQALEHPNHLQPRIAFLRYTSGHRDVSAGTSRHESLVIEVSYTESVHEGRQKIRALVPSSAGGVVYGVQLGEILERIGKELQGKE